VEKYGCVVSASRILEGHSGFDIQQSPRGLKLANSSLPAVLDISWLPAAAERYCISANPKDYLFIEIPIVTADYPNRNMDAFTFDTLTEFNPAIGRLTYSTFIGKPTHLNHKNQDPTAAKGVIFDATLRPQGRMQVVRILGGFDRTKDASLVADILSGKRNGYSMGAMVNQTECSLCGNISDGQTLCACLIEGKGRVIDSKLVYEKCRGVNFIETSSVEDPADPRALSNQLLH
jgi:hypothetical protein